MHLHSTDEPTCAFRLISRLLYRGLLPFVCRFGANESGSRRSNCLHSRFHQYHHYFLPLLYPNRVIKLDNSQNGSVFSSRKEECRLIGNDSKTLDATGVSIWNITHLTAFYIMHADATVGSTRGQNRSGNKLNIKKFLWHDNGRKGFYLYKKTTLTEKILPMCPVGWLSNLRWLNASQRIMLWSSDPLANNLFVYK